jgi:hypothetical protein
MMTNNYFILLVCEGPSDARVAKGFAERMIVENCNWLEYEAVRPTWQGVGADPYLSWKVVKKTIKEMGIPIPYGKFNQENGKPDAMNTRLALQIALKLSPIAVVFCRDQDNQPERKEGIEQARQEFQQALQDTATSLPIVIGFANPCTEAWILAGFVPQNRHEETNLERIEKAHPKLTQKPHTLTDRDVQKKHVATLAPPLEREALCWSETPLEQLHRHGSDCGLSEYLHELEEYLVPALSASSPRG